MESQGSWIAHKLVPMVPAALGIASILLLSAAYLWHQRGRDRLVLGKAEITLPADGRTRRTIPVRLASAAPLRPQQVTPGAANLRMLPDGDQLVLQVTSPVSAGTSVASLDYKGRDYPLRLYFAPDASDDFRDGTPEFLRLHSAADRRAFRQWFVSLARTAASLPPAQLPAEIKDCSALLRWCYRGALHAHDDPLPAGVASEALPVATSVAQYTYPFTPLGAALFRVRPGPFEAGDAANGSFAQFAEARTLLEDNTHLVGRDVRRALPGDLLFYRQLEQNSPFHSMILAPLTSDCDDLGAVYHTGPIGREQGEMRVVSMAQLVRHPDRRWRAIPENSNFLGVYRWNILREDHP